MVWPFCATARSQLRDLGAMEQQLAAPDWLQVPAVALLVGRNVELQHPRLAVLDRGVGLGQARLAVPQALHLGAGQHQARLDGLEDEVVVARPAILRDDTVGRVGFTRPWVGGFAPGAGACRGGLGGAMCLPAGDEWCGRGI